MKKANIKIDTYDMTKGWLLDIVTTKDEYEAWIYRKDTGIKDLMFGVSKDQETYDSFLDLAEVNYPEYTDDYMYDYS